jgi:hypothetical protein
MFLAKMASKVGCFVVSALLMASLPGFAFATEANYGQTFSNKAATGDELARAFFDLLSDTGSETGVVGTTTEQDEASKALVKPYLDPAFQLQRASGERYTAETYLPADVDKFELGDVRETRPSDDVVVVRYSVRTSQTLPDAALVMSGAKAPRLTVFHWSNADSRWKILSHANFNTPIAAICDEKPIVDNNLPSPASPEDQALGEGLMRNFYDLLVEGDAAPVLHPLFQYQNASGVGYTTLSERKKKTKLPETLFEHAVVTRDGDFLVVSLYHTAKERTIMGQHHLRGGKSANLATFHMGDQGAWSMIALASFVPANALPAGVMCVPAGKIETAP